MPNPWINKRIRYYRAAFTLPPPPFIIAANSSSIITLLNGMSYEFGFGPSNDSILFKIQALGLSPADGDITVTPPSNFEFYDGSTWQNTPFTIPYTGGQINTLTIYKTRLKVGLSVNSYAQIVTLSGANASDFTIDVSGQVTPGFDVDTIAFMNATGIPKDDTIYFIGTPQEITGHALWTYVNSNVLELKGLGTINPSIDFWSKFTALYPLIGGTDVTSKFNLKDPRDLDAAFRLSFFGGMMFNEFGAYGGGINSYAKTFLTPSVSLSLNNTSIFRYTTNKILVNSFGYNIGCESAGFYLYNRDNEGAAIDNAVNGNSGSVSALSNETWVMLSRKTNLSFKRYATSGDLSVASASINLPAFPLAIWGTNSQGTYLSLGNGVFGYVGIGEGLSDAEETVFRAIIADFESNLNRA